LPAIRSPQNLAGGLALIALALFAFWQTGDLEVGTAVRMGPGYFPRLIAILIAAVGVVLCAQSAFARGERLEPWSLKRLGLVLAAILVFAATIRTFGLVITGFLLVAVSAFAAPDLRWREAAIFAVAVVVFAVLLFPTALGLPIPVWPRL